ncbi:MAG: ribosome silencing factor [Comamonadaceae bacterium]|nr:MAG: ribosome silencing factor [Comamonadaceae bacterium]
MSTEASIKKDVQKLQRAIIDGLEDVKAQDIQVFNTEHLSPLFERVIVASGTSNRQTKALAASVRDAVKEAGFSKPRIEGEDNGEWIIVDCGPAVAHIMQPAIRQYYHLEEIWGDKPLKIKLGAPAPVARKTVKAVEPEEAKPRKAAPRRTAARAGAGASADKAPARAAPKSGAKAAPARKTAAKSAPVKTAPAKTARAAKPATPVKTVKVGAPAKRAAPAAKKAAAKKAPARKTAPKKA